MRGICLGYPMFSILKRGIVPMAVFRLGELCYSPFGVVSI